MSSICCLANLAGLFVVYFLAVSQTRRRALRPTLRGGGGGEGVSRDPHGGGDGGRELEPF